MADALTRRAKTEDLPEVTNLWNEMMNYHLSLDPRFDLASNNKEAYLHYLHSIKDNYDYAIFVSELEGRLVGYTIAMILTNPEIFSLERYGFIAEMAVTEACQNHG